MKPGASEFHWSLLQTDLGLSENVSEPQPFYQRNKLAKGRTGSAGPSWLAVWLPCYLMFEHAMGESADLDFFFFLKPRK